MNRKRLLGITAGVALVGIAVAGYWLFRSDATGLTLKISGNIEVTEADVSFKIPGRVLQRLVDEGQTVTAGQVVARLDDADLREQAAIRDAGLKATQAVLAELLAGSRPEEIAQARAAMDQAKARLDELLAGSRSQEIASAGAVLKQTQADAARAKLDYERYARLYEKVNVSAQQYDAAQAAKVMAEERQRQAEEQLKLVREGPRREQIDQARAAFAQARDRYLVVQEGPRKEQIDQARARVEEARQAAALSQTQLGYATLTAPFSAVVLSKNIEPGEYVAPGTPIINIADLANVYLRGYINETDLPRVKLGQAVSVTTDANSSKRYQGRVSFISSKTEFTPKTVQTEKERVKLVYRIKVDIPNPQQDLKPGMPVDAFIQLDHKS